MKKSLAILMFVVAATFLCGNALALDTYIPHITTGANDWTDYLQVNNNASSTATFTLTLYGSTGAQIYSQFHSVGGHSHSQIELKALNSSAATGKITYTETGLVFRVSYESMGGGVAEFKTIDTLGSNIGFYFSDFTTLVQWKGAAIANMGTTNANVTFYALGGSSQGSGGSILGTHTETIAPKAKLVGNNFNWSWLSGLNLGQIESIIAVAGSSSLCGIAISADMVSSRLLFTPATPVSNFSSLNFSGTWRVQLPMLINDCSIPNLPDYFSTDQMVVHSGTFVTVYSGTVVLTGSQISANGFDTIYLSPTDSNGCTTATAIAYRNITNSTAGVGVAMAITCQGSSLICSVGYGGTGTKIASGLQINHDANELDINKIMVNCCEATAGMSTEKNSSIDVDASIAAKSMAESLAQ